MKLKKIPFFAQCLEEGGIARVYVIDYPNLHIPADIKRPIMLEYGWSMPIPIPDLKWDVKGIYATLSFHQTSCRTFVPWEAVVAISPKGEGVTACWDFCVPSSHQDAVPNLPATPQATDQRRPTLSIVKDEP